MYTMYTMYTTHLLYGIHKYSKRLALMKKLSFKFIIFDETTFFNIVRIRFKNNGFNTY